MFVQKKSKKRYKAEDRIFILVMGSLYAMSLILVFIGRTSVWLLFLGGILLIFSSFISAYIGFTKRIVFVAPPLSPLAKGKRALFWAWLHLLVGVVILGGIILGAVTAY